MLGVARCLGSSPQHLDDEPPPWTATFVTDSIQGTIVPVTARLSKKFYEKLGEDVTNELVNWFNSVDATYRADVREMNELNFQRFDAKQAQRLAELKADIIKWMFTFWAPTTLAVVALLLRA
jgi:hypothetical protein